MGKWTDDELAAEAQTGLRGQGAIVEALRRHRVTLERLERSATRLERVMLALTLVGLALAGVQIWIAL